jgi:hypothetical protein
MSRIGGGFQEVSSPADNRSPLARGHAVSDDVVAAVASTPSGATGGLSAYNPNAVAASSESNFGLGTNAGRTAGLSEPQQTGATPGEAGFRAALEKLERLLGNGKPEQEPFYHFAALRQEQLGSSAGVAPTVEQTSRARLGGLTPAKLMAGISA